MAFLTVALDCAVLNRSVMSDFATLQTVALQAPRPWDSPGKNTGVGCRSLLQGIFLTQGSNLGLLHCRQIDSLPSEPLGKPKNTAVVGPSLLQGNFGTQELNRGHSLALHVDSLPAGLPGKPFYLITLC